MKTKISTWVQMITLVIVVACIITISSSLLEIQLSGNFPFLSQLTAILSGSASVGIINLAYKRKKSCFFVIRKTETRLQRQSYISQFTLLPSSLDVLNPK